MDVLRGYSKTGVSRFGEFYIKHLDLYSAEEIDERNLSNQKGRSEP